MYKIDLVALIYSQFISYPKLIEIVNESCRGSNASTAYLYIDLNSILKNVFRNIGNIEIGDYTNLTSTIINMVIHYRWFFRSRYQTDCKVILVFSYNSPDYCNQILPNYNDSNYQLFCHSEMMTELLHKNLNLIKLICTYLDGTYYYESDMETGTVIKSIMDLMYTENRLQDNEFKNFVITKDPYNYQLVSFYDTIIIRPKIQKGPNGSGDTSYWMDKYTVWKYILSERNTSYDKPINLDPGLISLVYAISGIQQRHIYSTVPIKKTIQTIQTLIDRLIIPNRYIAYSGNAIATIYANSSKNRSNIPIDNLLQTKEVIDMINFFRVIDIFSQSEFHKAYDYNIMKSTIMTNLYDSEGLKTINDKYFRNNPIDFQRY